MNGRKVIHLRADATEQVHIRGARAVTVDCGAGAGRDGGRDSGKTGDGREGGGAELTSLLRAALALRSCEVTERNPISSRSHAVCSITFLTRENKPQGKLTLCDLAGLDTYNLLVYYILTKRQL